MLSPAAHSFVFAKGHAAGVSMSCGTGEQTGYTYTPMLPIPPDRLSPDVLDALIEEFVTRHGTNLSDADAKSAQVRAQLRTGQIIIVYDEKTDSTNIVPKDAKEPPPAAHAPPQHRSPPSDDEPQIVYDEPPPPDPIDY